jgi:hypothetical protein
MTQFKSSGFRPKSAEGLDIEKILSAPLIAASEANSQMQKEQTKARMESAFDVHGDTYSPKMIELVLIRSVLDQQAEEGGRILREIRSTFYVPILTILPLSSLAVDDVSVQFEMEITNQYTKAQNYGSTAAKHFGQPQEKTQLAGRISYDSTEQNPAKTQNRSQNGASLKVDIHAGPLPLPLGVTTILNAYTKAIQPAKIGTSPAENEQEPQS